MSVIVVTAPTFQAPMSWLKDEAPKHERAAHVGHGSDVPGANVLVEGRGIVERVAHVGHGSDVPGANVLGVDVRWTCRVMSKNVDVHGLVGVNPLVRRRRSETFQVAGRRPPRLRRVVVWLSVAAERRCCRARHVPAQSSGPLERLQRCMRPMVEAVDLIVSPARLPGAAHELRMSAIDVTASVAADVALGDEHAAHCCPSARRLCPG